MEGRPLHFIGEKIQVTFEIEPRLEKKPGAPNAFTWRESEYRITRVLAEWHDYRRHGRMARNMQAAHAAAATRRGSWGVGLDFYRVATDRDRVFDLYFDRAPKDADQRKGAWFLYQELEADINDSDIPAQGGL